MKASIAEHRIASGFILAVAVGVAYISFTGEPVEAFLFPRIIAVVMLTLAAWNFFRAITGVSKVGEGVSWELAKTIAPGAAIILVYIFVLAKFLGFYTASMVTFVSIFAVYDPAPHTEIMSWVKRIAVAFVFMAVMYGLFSLLLQVQTPRGMFF
ncbi:tripartite tricarboxylate transporter TctB family protein [Pseudahrensia aquimaris]|uniref:Tripartite tricarboxylate transporter TctB family protein n=1 Tax=Pseudahrensia aquimaris TaxID=744461 RepID=A0ABW3FEY4_9HYPH